MIKCWALNDFYKVNPVSGNILELNPKEYAKTPCHGFGEANAIWDNATSSIKLAGSRNETVGFQIILQDRKINEKSIRIDFSQQSNSYGKGPAFILKTYREWYIHLNGQYYADGLIPIEPGKPVDLRKPKNIVPKQKTQAFYLELFIPEGTPAGAHNLKIGIYCDAKIQRIISLQLTVLSFVLPSRPSFIVEYNNYCYLSTSRRTLRAKTRLKYLASKTFDAELVMGHRLARDHYGTLNIIPYGMNGLYSPSMVPKLGKQHNIKTFRPWNAKFQHFLNGRAFSKGYGKGEPVAIFNLPFNLAWPAPFQLYPSAKYRKIITKAITRFAAHILQKGWLKTRFLLHLNHKSRKCIFPFNTDEPTRKKDYRILRDYGSCLKSAFRTRKCPISFRVDIGHFECNCIMDKCDQQPNENRCSHSSQIDDIVNLWVCSYDHANQKSFLRHRQRGKQVWIYMSASWINRPLTDMGQILLNAYSLNAQGYCFWSSAGWESNPWQNVDDIMGTGFLFYPGKDVGVNALLPSLRLKAARRAIIDIEYLQFLKKRGNSKARHLLQSFIRKFDQGKISLMDGEKANKGHFNMTDNYDWQDLRNDITSEILKYE